MPITYLGKCGGLMQKPKILVVEDERDVSKVISINLELEGMEVTEAHDGPTALALIEESKPDCVVLDVMLPKISGWDILKFIKNLSLIHISEPTRLGMISY